MGFFLKKVIGAVFMPLPAGLLVAALGVVLWLRGRRRLGPTLVGGALLALWVAGLPGVADALVRAVETNEPAFPGDSVAWVVVLSGGHRSDPALPVSARLSSPTLHRVAEGVAIATAQPWSTLVLSGWGGADSIPNASVSRDVARSWGFPAERVVLDPAPRDTEEEARLLAPRLRGHPFALVTSATHMDRALGYFRAQGLDPVPAPTGHLSQEPTAYGVTGLLPAEANLWRTRIAMHEILGMLWARLRGAF